MSTLHITSGDFAAELIKQAGFNGDVLAWRDMLYIGKRCSGWPDEQTLIARSEMLSTSLGGALSAATIKSGIQKQYDKLKTAPDYDFVLLWFDDCLYDLSMLAHILNCLDSRKVIGVELILIGSFPGIFPFNGLGQLSSEQFKVIYKQRSKVTDAQYKLAKIVDEAFACQNIEKIQKLSAVEHLEIPGLQAAVRRWLEELPDPKTGLGKLGRLALDAVKSGLKSPVEIFKYTASHDSSPQFWGDTTLWEKINHLADRGLVQITGPSERLPQWVSEYSLNSFHILPQ